MRCGSSGELSHCNRCSGDGSGRTGRFLLASSAAPGSREHPKRECQYARAARSTFMNAGAPPGAIGCKAPRHRWHSWQRRQCRICKLQHLKRRGGFESHPLRIPHLQRHDSDRLFTKRTFAAKPDTRQQPIRWGVALKNGLATSELIGLECLMGVPTCDQPALTGLPRVQSGARRHDIRCHLRLLGCIVERNQ
jgi:hypothetical protein